jgi:hypothetical protein
MTKLLAATGYIGGGLTVEVINLDDSNPNLICDNLPNLPFGRFGSAGYLFRGTPIICGGQGERRCNSFESGTWKSMSSTNEERFFPVSTVLSPTSNEKDDIILIAGSYNGVSTAESFDGFNWNQTKFSNLPEPISINCVAKINSTTLMSIGGSKYDLSSKYTGETNFFNVIQNKWVAGPQLTIPRVFHACAVMNWKNATSGIIEKVIVVAGTTVYRLLSKR